MARDSDVTGRGPDDIVDCVVVGGGPAGLSAALNLARAVATVALIDTGRPRNAATLRSHGFLSRDGIPPHELRKLGVAELREYPHIRVHERTTVTRVARAGGGSHPFVVELSSRVAGDPVQGGRPHGDPRDRPSRKPSAD